jgi:hypothetical protein
MPVSSFNKIAKRDNDELYTPKILVDPMIKYIVDYDNNKNAGTNSHITVWCPFDKEKSEFVLALQENKINVEYSHIDYGQDFFTYEPKNWDLAISNPPFSRKLDVFKRLDSFDKPWAMIMNVMALNYMEINNYFYENPPIQLLFFDKRVSFNGNPSSFGSCYVCRDILPKDLVFEHLDNCNSGDNYIPSRMY